jgi:hypothetical protein
MIHIVKLIEGRFPEQSGKIVRVLTFLSLGALILGIGLLLS